MPNPSPRRRWFRISLRGLMILILVVGAVVGWMAQTIRTQRQAVAAVQAAGGFVRYDWQIEILPNTFIGPLPGTDPSAKRWVRRWLGDELFQSVEQVSLFDLRSAATLAAISRFDRLEILVINDKTGDEVDYGALRRLHRLAALHLDGPGLTDTKLAAVCEIGSLRSLVIERCHATDAGFAHLARLRNLTHLTLYDTPNLTDAGLARTLAEMPRLRSLDLTGFPRPLPSTIRGLARSQPGLVALQLGDGPVTDADLAALGQLTQLEVVNLNGSAVTDAGVAHLAGLTKLRELHLNDVPITDVGLAHLAGLIALEQLYCSTARVTDAGLATLTRFPNLSMLSLCGARITDAGLPVLARLTGLISLELDGNLGITDAGMTPAHFGPQLQLLSISGTKVTQSGYQALVAARPNLEIMPEAESLPAPTSP